ncbi:MAG: hypothetical protein QXQ46_07910, partial [Thermoplasmatales archaeon]
KNVWLSYEINRAYDNFYLDTIETMNKAYVRPNFDGFLNIQRNGGMIIHDFLRNNTSPIEAYKDLADLWVRYRNPDFR